MIIHTLYSGPAGTGRLVITARPGKGSGGDPVWLVSFQRWSKAGGKMLDQCAAWMPTLQAWDRSRWHPIGSRLIPLEALLDAVVWLRGREVDANA